MKTIAMLCLTLAASGCATDALDDAPQEARDVSIAEPAEPRILGMTAGEALNAPRGYLAVAPLQASDDPDSSCLAANAVAIRVADGTAPGLKVASLCVGEQGDEVVLRACAADEVPISQRSGSSLTEQTGAWGDGCYWCTSDRCNNNPNLPQRKEGVVSWCPGDWTYTKSCCWASNGGCCS